METSTIGILITLIAIILFITEKVPLAVTAMGAALAMGVTKCITLNEAVSGFGSSVTMLVAGMMIVGDAVFATGLADKIGNWIQKAPFAKNEKSFAIVVVAACTLMSAFFSNVATIAMFIPLIAVAAKTSNGKIAAKNVTLAAGFGTAIGGGATLIGSTAQLVSQGIMVKMGLPAMSMFTLTKLMGPLCIVWLIYYYFFGYSWQNKVVADMQDVEMEEIETKKSDKEVPVWKMWLSGIAVIFCVVAFLTDIWNVGIVALVAATILIGAGCLEFKSAMRNVDWNTVTLVATTQGFALGLDKSGGGKVLSDFAINLFGGPAASPYVLLAVVIILAAVLTNFMTNTALTAMLVPIIIPMARKIGADPSTFAIGITIASNIALSTPIGTSAVTQTMVCGYRYMDYVKSGLPINILLILLVIIGVPFIYGM